MRQLWERNNKHPYPRGVMRFQPSKDVRRGDKALRTYKEVREFCSFGKDLFVDIFSEDQKRSKVYDCIFLDIDHKDLLIAFMRTQYIVEILKLYGAKVCYVVFSGSKGYHVYIPIIDMMLHNYRTAVCGWLYELDLVKYVDAQVITPNRVSRVVGTVNTKSGLACTYLGTGDQFIQMAYGDVMERVKEGSVGFVEYGKNDLKEIKRFDQRMSLTEVSYDGMIGKSTVWSKAKHYPECMAGLLVEAIKGTDLGHLERLEMGKFMLHIHNGDVDKVMDLYRRMGDFNEGKTRYHLEYIKKRQLKMSSCPNLIDAGLCPYGNEAEDECPFYPSLNKFMRIDRERRMDVKA